MSKVNLTEDQIYNKLDEFWQLCDVEGFACPSYEEHKRAFIFPNKSLWAIHMIEHLDKGDFITFNVKQEVTILLRQQQEVSEEYEDEFVENLQDELLEPIITMKDAIEALDGELEND